MTDQPVLDPLSPRSLLAKSWRFSGVSIVAALIGAPVLVFVARQLGPEALGRAQYVLLAYAYAAFVRLGTFEAGQRELVNEVARGRGEKALFAQNVGFTVDLVVSVLPGLALLAIAWSFGDPVRRVGFALAPVAVVGSSVASYLANLHLAHGRFKIAAYAALVRQVGGQLLVVVGVVAFGPYGLVLAPMVADWAVIGLYRVVAPRLGLALAFERTEARRLVRAGFPLGAMALVYWSYSLAGNTAAALWTSVNAFAFYVFAAAPVLLARRALAGVSTVLTPTLWGELGRSGTDDVAKQARRLVWLLAVLAGVVTNFAQATFGPVVVAAAPRFQPAILVFEILAFDIVLYVVPMVPSLVLDSLVVNKQWPHLWLWTAALVVNMAANYAVTHIGYGIVAIAWNDVAVQALVAVALLYMTRQHLRSGLRTALPVAGIAAWTAVVWFILRLVLHVSVGDALAVTARAGMWRVVIVAAAWAPVVGLIWVMRKRERYRARSVISA
jgi:O-antigen/teichoic acid export membrane protein